MPLVLDATYDPTTDIGKVRLLIFDVDVDSAPPDAGTARADWSVLFVDAEIAVYLSLYAFNPTLYAAADCLDSLAANAAALAKLQRIGDYEQDTRGIAKDLRAQAEQLRHRGDTIPAELITDLPYTDANWTRMVIQPRAGE